MSLITLEIKKSGYNDGVVVNDDVAGCFGWGDTPTEAIQRWVHDFTGLYEVLKEHEHRALPEGLSADLGRMRAVLDL